MKKLSDLRFVAMMLLVSLLSLSFTSCSDDDDEELRVPDENVDDWDDDDDEGSSSDDTADKILGTWNVTMDDPSWKTTLTFKSNGTYTADDYYDIMGDGTFSEYSGSCTGSYSITSRTLTIKSSSSDYESVVTGSYKINTLTSRVFELEDNEGWKCYGVK